MPYCINFLHVNFQNYQRKLWDLVYLYTQIAIKIFLLIILIHVCWLIFFSLWVTLHDMWNVSSLTREPVHAAVEVWSTNHCTVREFPMLTTLFLYIIVAYIFAFKENMVIFNDHSQLYWISTVFFWASCFGEFGDEWISQSFLSHDLKDLFFFLNSLSPTVFLNNTSDWKHHSDLLVPGYELGVWMRACQKDWKKFKSMERKQICFAHFASGSPCEEMRM